MLPSSDAIAFNRQKSIALFRIVLLLHSSLLEMMYNIWKTCNNTKYILFFLTKTFSYKIRINVLKAASIKLRHNMKVKRQKSIIF